MAQYPSIYVGEEIVPPTNVTRVAWVTRHWPEEFYLRILQRIYVNAVIINFNDRFFNSYEDFAEFIRRLNQQGFVPFPVVPVPMGIRAQSDNLAFGRFSVTKDDDGNWALRYVEWWENGQRRMLITGRELEAIEQRLPSAV